jgi:RHS repeat-associated protein
LILVYFTAKERDAETGLDFFGARYYSGAMGRFTSPDPLGINLLRILNPQRWNMYAYAVNNPLAYTDPDGRDALAVTFSTGAHGLGHAGFATVHTDGTTRFADFGPKHSGSFHDEGQYTFADNLNARVVYSNGKPTKDSLTAIANELADREGVPRESVHVAYFKTSDAETATGDAYINDAEARQRNHTQPSYWGGFRDCIWFCYNGLKATGRTQGSSPLTVPNMAWWDFWLQSGITATGTRPDPEKPQPPHERCLQDRSGNCVSINSHASTMAYGFVALTVVLLLIFAWGCSTAASTPARPSGVPAQVTYVPGGKVGGWWQYCIADEHLQAHCTVWNRGWSTTPRRGVSAI